MMLTWCGISDGSPALEFPGALNHVTSRGNARQRVFLDDEDRETFLTTLTWVVARFRWCCQSYCLIDKSNTSVGGH